MTRRPDPNGDSVNKIFGEFLPEVTQDERDDDPSDRETERDAWLRDNVPPHHH